MELALANTGRKGAYDEAAESAGMDRSDWMRHVLNNAAKRTLRGKGSSVE